MRVISVCVLVGTLLSVSCERHSLTYIYTALSKRVNNPGIHEFTAMGLLDTKMIDYFDSDLQKKVPKKAWMKEKLSPDYWVKGTDSRKSKQQWFKVNLDILKERMNQTDDEVHVLQWMHGCEADLLPDENNPSQKKLVFQRGIDQYSYNGNNFLYFDDAHEVWVAAAKEAEQTKRKWDEVQVLKDYTKGYLEKECLEWLRKFMDYGKAQLQHAVPPKVYMFASPSKQKTSFLLNCMATGFYPPDIILEMKRNGRVLKERDGLMTTGIRPNEDDTYQRRDRIEILRTETAAEYTCEVYHAATNMSISQKWDNVLPKYEEEESGAPVVVVVGGVVVLLLLCIGISLGVYFYRKRGERTYDGVSTVSSGVSGGVSSGVKVDACVPLCVDPGSSSSSDSSGRGSIESMEKKEQDKSSQSSSGLGSGEETTPLNSEESGGSRESV